MATEAVKGLVRQMVVSNSGSLMGLSLKCKFEGHTSTSQRTRCIQGSF